MALDANVARSACETRGWVIDANGNVAPTSQNAGENLLDMGEGQLQKLAEYVAYLEQPQCRI